jgi:hypothetical protein
MEYDAPPEPVSEKHRIGALLAALGSYLLFYRAQTLPAAAHSLDRPLCLLLACALFAYAWGVLMAMLARRMGWSPKTCHLVGYPLLALAALGRLSGPHGKDIFDTGGLLILAELTGRLCRFVAYPELGWSGKAPQDPPLSIDPRLHSQPDALAKR